MNSINIQFLILYFLLHSSFFLVGMDNSNQITTKIEMTIGMNPEEPIAYHVTVKYGLQVKVPVKIINYKTIDTITGQPVSKPMSFFPRYLPLKMIQKMIQMGKLEKKVQIGRIYDASNRLVMISAGALVEEENVSFVPTTIENNTLCFYNQNHSFSYVPVKITFNDSFKELFAQQLDNFNNNPVLTSEPVLDEKNALEYAIEEKFLEIHNKILYHAERGFPNERKLEDLDRLIKNNNGLLFHALTNREKGHIPKSRLKKTPPLIQYQSTTE